MNTYRSLNGIRQSREVETRTDEIGPFLWPYSSGRFGGVFFFLSHNKPTPKKKKNPEIIQNKTNRKQSLVITQKFKSEKFKIDKIQHMALSNNTKLT